MAVADGGDPEAGGQVDEAVPVHVQDVGAEGLVPDERCGGRISTGGPERVDAGRLGGREAAGELSGAGPGRRDDDLGEKIA
jgi:hypothetical protein